MPQQLDAECVVGGFLPWLLPVTQDLPEATPFDVLPKGRICAEDDTSVPQDPPSLLDNKHDLVSVSRFQTEIDFLLLSDGCLAMRFQAPEISRQ